MTNTEWQAERRQLIEQHLQQLLQPAEAPQIAPRLCEAMAYSTLNGGKRLRGLLVFAAGEALQAPIQSLTQLACGFECLHAYSLIHDDLPAMDDDDLRRGKPSNHKAFDEATAILAGDALQALAFELLLSLPDSTPAAHQIKLAREFAIAVGRQGMVGGQMLDIQATNTLISQSELQQIHRAKTGALIRASVICGGLAAPEVSKEQLAALTKYAENIGLAFQIIDDVLDETSDTQTLGKQVGADQSLNKATYPRLMGLEASKALAEKLVQEALESVASISDNTDPLVHLAEQVIARTH